MSDNVALCVDLDGTLIHSDLLLESFLLLIKDNPLYLLLVPFWLLGGKARLKREIASRVKLDGAALPYTKPLVAWLREQKAAGRQLWLCTASDESLAHAVADHLGFFDGVQGLVDSLPIARLMAGFMQGVEVGAARQDKALVLQQLFNQRRVVTVLSLVAVIVVLPDIGDVLQEKHGQDIVLVDARIHRATEGVAGVPDGCVDGVLLDGRSDHGSVGVRFVGKQGECQRVELLLAVADQGMELTLFVRGCFGQ